MLRVLLIDDQRLLLDALQLLLATRCPEIELDLASNEAQALAAVVQHDYELILLDWWLGSNDAAACFLRLREVAAGARIVVVSADDNAATVRRALDLGAAGFLPKSVLSAGELVEAIRIVAAGGIYLPGHAPDTAAGAGRPAWVPKKLEHCFPGITARQRDVLRVLLRGESDKQIARELDIALSTVKTHVQALFRLMEVSCRAEAVALAARRGARVD